MAIVWDIVSGRKEPLELATRRKARFPVPKFLQRKDNHAGGGKKQRN